MKYTHYPRHRGLPGPSTVVPASGKPKYSCPMHPEVQQRHLDNCPQCGMTLIPMTAIASTDEQENTLLRAMTSRFWIVAALTLPVFVLALAHAIPALARLPWAHSGASLESIVSRRCRMNAALVLFAGAISTSMGKLSEEQCRAKYGQYTCAGEARLNTQAGSVVNVSNAPLTMLTTIGVISFVLSTLAAIVMRHPGFASGVAQRSTQATSKR